MATDKRQLKILMFGAHPDDCDVKAGGLAALYADAVHRVRLVSLTNGDAGHYDQGGAPLAWRRRQEAREAGRVLGAEYIVLDHHDGELMPTLDLRAEVIGLIRAFQPDLVTCPRPWDYHPDHRATGEVVIDALYLCTVPNAVSHVPHLRQMPVAAYVMDGFQRPCPFQPNVAVGIDGVWERKVRALACHASQVFEWLPYNRITTEGVPTGDAERLAWIQEWYASRFAALADSYRPLLIERYGPELGSAIEHCEALEIAEYGRQPSADEMADLFPF